MSAQFTRAGDPNDDRGPSMMVRHAEQRAREAAANADRYLRETFPRANATTLALALKEFNNDVALAKDALKAVSYTHLRAHETGRNLVCRLLLEKKNFLLIGNIMKINQSSQKKCK